MKLSFSFGVKAFKFEIKVNVSKIDKIVVYLEKRRRGR